MKIDPDLIRHIRVRWGYLSLVFDERQKRRICAAEAQVLGRGGVKAMAEITGMPRSAISRGRKEMAEMMAKTQKKARRPGGGRKKSPTD